MVLQTVQCSKMTKDCLGDIFARGPVLLQYNKPFVDQVLAQTGTQFPSLGTGYTFFCVDYGQTINGLFITERLVVY